MEPAQPPACVVLLNGFPGTGKYAVARALCSKLGDTNTRLIDNHLTIDPAEATHPGRGYEHKALRDIIRRAVFQDLKRLPKNITTIVLTGCLGQNSEDVALYAEHVEIAQARGVPFLSFTLTVEKSEHLLRLQSLDRVYGQKTKLNDPAVLETIMTNNEILDPTIVVDEGSDVDFRSIRHHLIDTTGLTIYLKSNLHHAAIGCPGGWAGRMGSTLAWTIRSLWIPPKIRSLVSTAAGVALDAPMAPKQRFALAKATPTN